jgi:hypothetical protein
MKPGFFFDGLEDREVHFQSPQGAAPEAGWPVILVFQGSLASAEFSWEASRSTVKGWFYQALLTDRLLSAGFAVITPEVRLDGLGAWQTNLPPCSLAWEGCGDDVLMLAVLDEIESGGFGSLDPEQKGALGISSGGYMI